MRYALYFSPPADDPLTLAAANWLGRDAFGRATDTAESRRALVEEPARYGFHGTLKAPFALAEGASEAALFEAFDRFCDATPAFQIESLVIGQLGPFFALVPGKGHHHGIDALSAACVEAFEPFRAPLSESDIARRKPETLPERERRYLTQWGYPYVFDAFRFHMTLTGPVPEADRDDVRGRLALHFSAFAGKPATIGHLALFAEPARGAPFHVARIRPLRPALSGKAA